MWISVPEMVPRFVPSGVCQPVPYLWQIMQSTHLQTPDSVGVSHHGEFAGNAAPGMLSGQIPHLKHTTLVYSTSIQGTPDRPHT